MTKSLSSLQRRQVDRGRLIEELEQLRDDQDSA